jgi:hypothetical protein
LTEKFKSQTFPVQYISQVWMGGRKVGVIEQSGGYSQIHYETHPNWSRLLGKGGDVGGPMILHRTRKSFSLGHCFAGQGNGSQIALRPSSYSNGPAQPLNSTLYGYGGTAISRTLPTNPAADVADSLAQSIGRDAIPRAIGASFLKERTNYFRNLGSEYLNVQFGWIPFVNDLHDLMEAVIHADDILQKVRRGSGHTTRVGYKFPKSSSVDSTYVPAFYYSVDSTLSGWDAGPISRSLQSGQDIWFVGAYRYQIPATPAQLDNSARFRQYATHVLGMRPTLENVWDAAPWSWLVDWAVNVGDVAHNISAFGHDGLILEYGYIMSHVYEKETWTAPGGSNSSGCTTTNANEWKVRFPASPYGFGLTYDGLTASQKAILAAVGISHF